MDDWPLQMDASFLEQLRSESDELDFFEITRAEVLAVAQQIGVDTDAARFPAQALAAGTLLNLITHWQSQVRAEQGDWSNFFRTNLPNLWEHFLPDDDCSDLLGLRLAAVIRAEVESRTFMPIDGIPAALFVLKRLIRFLSKFPVAQRMNVLKESILPTYESEYTSDDFVMLFDRYQSLWHEVVIETIPGFLELLQDDPKPRAELEVLRDVLIAINTMDLDAARKLACDIEAKNSDDLWIRIFVGDLHQFTQDIDRAVDFWKKALMETECPSIWDAAFQRLEICVENTDYPIDLDSLEYEFPNPYDKQFATPTSAYVDYVEREPRNEFDEETIIRNFSDSDVESSTDDIPRLTKAKKVGRNDPCPCGSGKKYKKCCLK